MDGYEGLFALSVKSSSEHRVYRATARGRKTAETVAGKVRTLLYMY